MALLPPRFLFPFPLRLPFRFLLPVLVATLASHPFLLAGGFLPLSVSLSLPRGGGWNRRDLLGAGAGLLVMPPPAEARAGEDPPQAVVRWGIVGLGDVTQVKSGPPFWKCEGSELVAVVRRTPGKAAEFAKGVPVGPSGVPCVGYEDLDRFLEHPGLEAVYVCTRPGTHASVARRVAGAGLACYVEKPVGRCASEASELTELFRSKGLPLYTAYISRAYERTLAVRRLLGDGVLGDRLERVSYVLKGTGGARDLDAGGSLPWRLDAAQSGGGLITDVGCHLIDRIDALCGPLVGVEGSAEHAPSPGDRWGEGVAFAAVENRCSATATIGASEWASMPNGGCAGASVDLSWDFAIDDPARAVDELRFFGSNGRSLKMQGMSPSGPIEVLDADGATVLETLSFAVPEHTGQGLIQAVTNDLIDRKNGGPNRSRSDPERQGLLSFGENAVRAQRVIDTMLDSYYGGREIGYWDRMDSWPGRPVQKQQES